MKVTKSIQQKLRKVTSDLEKVADTSELSFASADEPSTSQEAPKNSVESPIIVLGEDDELKTSLVSDSNPEPPKPDPISLAKIKRDLYNKAAHALYQRSRDLYQLHCCVCMEKLEIDAQGNFSKIPNARCKNKECKKRFHKDCRLKIVQEVGGNVMECGSHACCHLLCEEESIMFCDLCYRGFCSVHDDRDPEKDLCQECFRFLFLRQNEKECGENNAEMRTTEGRK